MAPVIAIVGSADPRRTYEPDLRHGEQAGEACVEVGRALAARDCHLLVYSSDSQFIEGDVIRGYCAVVPAGAGRIEVRCPDDATIDFPELQTHRDVFDVRRDMSPDWETSFFRSLFTADGIVLVGGGRGTFTSGLLALAQRIPLLPLATFGGAARRAWHHLDRDRGFAKAEEVEAMLQDWGPLSAERLVDGLLSQIKRRAEVHRRRERTERAERRATLASYLAVVGLLLVAAAAVPLAWSWRPGTSPVLAALVLAPLAAGMSGALLQVASGEGRDWARSAVLGLGAGFVTNLLFVAAQIAATPDITETDGARRLLLFALPIGFVAGITFDTVYQKLRATDVTRTDAIVPGNPADRQ